MTLLTLAQMALLIGFIGMVIGFPADIQKGILKKVSDFMIIVGGILLILALGLEFLGKFTACFN